MSTKNHYFHKLSWQKLPSKKANETEPKADGNTIKTNLFSNSIQFFWISFSPGFHFQIPHLFYGLLLLSLPLVKDQYIHIFKVFSNLWVKGATVLNSFCVYKKET